jgi:hypothetical protein
MAKSSSPIRIEQSLMNEAGIIGKDMHRSATQQLEYWADMGRQLEGLLSTNDIIKIKSGMAQLRVDSVSNTPIDPDSVFDTIERDRLSGALASKVTNAKIPRYQASVTYKGYLEQIAPNGSKRIGTFTGGKFVPSHGLTSQ